MKKANVGHNGLSALELKDLVQKAKGGSYVERVENGNTITFTKKLVLPDHKALLKLLSLRNVKISEFV